MTERDAIALAAAHREVACAALDVAHRLHVENLRLREQLLRLRSEQAPAAPETEQAA